MAFITPFLPRFDDALQKLAWKTAAILATGMGLSGSDLITTGHSATGDWWCLHALGGDVTFNNVTFRPGTSTGSFVGLTLSNGDRLYGNITGVNVASGNLVCYRTSSGSP